MRNACSVGILKSIALFPDSSDLAS